MSVKYYSSRNAKKNLDVDGLYVKLQNLYLLFRDKDYFREKAKITSGNISNDIKRLAAIKLNFQPFPITRWSWENTNEENIFDTIEFLYEYTSKPGEQVLITEDDGYSYYDHVSYDEISGRSEFREYANIFLNDYKNGYELNSDGEVVSLGENGLEFILSATIIPYDLENVDKKVSHAINSWKKRGVSLTERREAIRELADVFEWLKKSKNWKSAIGKEDNSMIFNIANNFSIRHHNSNQKQNYDKNIWYSWMFHFFLASYHAMVRLLIQQESSQEIQE